MIDEVGYEFDVDAVGIAVVDLSHDVLGELIEVFDPAVLFPDTSKTDGLTANIVGRHSIFNASPLFDEFFACIELLHPGLPGNSEAGKGGKDVDVEVGVIGLISGDETTDGDAAIVAVVLDADAAAVEEKVFLLEGKTIPYIGSLDASDANSLQRQGGIVAELASSNAGKSCCAFFGWRRRFVDSNNGQMRIIAFVPKLDEFCVRGIKDSKGMAINFQGRLPASAEFVFQCLEVELIGVGHCDVVVLLFGHCRDGIIVVGIVGLDDGVATAFMASIAILLGQGNKGCEAPRGFLTGKTVFPDVNFVAVFALIFGNRTRVFFAAAAVLLVLLVEEPPDVAVLAAVASTLRGREAYLGLASSAFRLLTTTSPESPALTSTLVGTPAI